jgi:hypothetical protein
MRELFIAAMWEAGSPWTDSGFHRTSWFSHTITSVCMVIVEWLLVGGR